MKLRVGVFLLVLIAQSACAPSDPLEQRLEAKKPTDFDQWRSRISARLDPVQRRWYEHAMQEWQLYSVSTWEGQGSAEQHAKLVAELDHLTLREILIRGYELSLDRRAEILQDHRILYQAHVDLLARPRTTPDGAVRLRSTMEQIAQQITELEDEQSEETRIVETLRLSAAPASRSR